MFALKTAIEKQMGLTRAFLAAVLPGLFSANAAAHPEYWYVTDPEWETMFPDKYVDIRPVCIAFGQEVARRDQPNTYPWGEGSLSHSSGWPVCAVHQLNGGWGYVPMRLTRGGCGSGYLPIPGSPDKFPFGTSCASVVDVYENHPPPTCNPSVGNPIRPLTGEKIETLDLGFGLRGKGIVLTYNSGRAPWLRQPEEKYPMLGAFGELWFSNLHINAQIPNYTSLSFLRPDGTQASIELPKEISSMVPGQRIKGRKDELDTFEFNTAPGFYGYLLRDQTQKSLTYYQAIGGDRSRVAGVYFAGGGSLTYTSGGPGAPGLTTR